MKALDFKDLKDSSFDPLKADMSEFDWEKDSWAVAQLFPELIDFEKFNREQMFAVRLFCPEKLTKFPPIQIPQFETF